MLTSSVPLESQAEGSLTKDQHAFLEATRAWLGRTSLSDLRPRASHEPRHTKQGDEFPGVIWIILGLRRRHKTERRPRYSHQTVQLGLTADGLLFGGWQGDYVWEFDKNEAFRFSVPSFGLAEAIAAAHAWPERELPGQSASATT